MFLLNSTHPNLHYLSLKGYRMNNAIESIHLYEILGSTTLLVPHPDCSNGRAHHVNEVS